MKKRACHEGASSLLIEQFSDTNEPRETAQSVSTSLQRCETTTFRRVLHNLTSTRFWLLIRDETSIHLFQSCYFYIKDWVFVVLVASNRITPPGYEPSICGPSQSFGVDIVLEGIGPL